MDAHDAPRLVLEVEQRFTEVSPGDGLRLTIGKAEGNQFVCGGPYTSRRHARIERQHNDFYLVDESTNGTYVQTEDQTVTFLHRERLRLWGSGWIALGEPLHTAVPIHFRHNG